MGRTLRKRKRKQRVDTAGYDAEIDITLFKWGVQNGLQINGVTTCFFTETGRGLKATKYFYENSKIISIPIALMVTFDDVWRSEVKRFLTNPCRKLTTKAGFTLFVLLERNKGHLSKYWPYINSLPTYYTTPSYISANEAPNMPGFIYSYIKSQQEVITQQYVQIKNALKACKHPQYKNINMEDVRWAWNTINTRSVYLHPTTLRCFTEIDVFDINYALAPVLDFLNHKASACCMQVDIDKEKNLYEMKTPNQFKPGDQLFINYGPHCNRTLFVEYGFFVPDNIHASIPITIELMSRYFGGISNQTVSILKTLRVNIDKMSCTVDGFDWSFVVTAHVLKSNMTAQVDNLNSCLYSCIINESCSLLLRDMMKKHLESLQQLSVCTSKIASVVKGLLQSEISLMEQALRNTMKGICYLE